VNNLKSYHSLGLVASGRRNIKSGAEWDRLYDKTGLMGTNPIVAGDQSDTYDTLKEMERIVRATLKDTANVAVKLKGATMAATMRNNWQHVYDHFQYERDAEGIEQLRRPSRSWKDRKKGIDCDCMSIALSSMLTNQKIPHAFRMTEYNADIGWQHVYVVVPKTMGATMDSRENYYVLDCVVDKFDYEVPYKKKYDHFMKIQYLNGLDSSILNGGVTPSLATQARFEQVLSGYGSEFETLGCLSGVNLSAVQVGNLFIRSLKQHLINTRYIASYNPTLLSGGYSPVLFQQRLDYLLQNFDDAAKRDAAFSKIEELEQKERGLSGHDLGSFFSKVKKAVKSVKNAAVHTVKAVSKGVAKGAKATVKTVGKAAKAVGKGVAKAAVATGKAVATAAKVVGKAIIRFNPLSIAIRNGILFAMQINFLRFAEKLGYGYWTEDQIKAKGLDVGEYRKTKSSLESVRKVYKGLQGKMDKLDSAIKKGWQRGVSKHHLVAGLGDPEIAAAGGVLATIATILGKLDFTKFFAGKASSPHEALTDDAIKSAEIPTGSDVIKDDEGDVPAAATAVTASMPSGGDTFVPASSGSGSSGSSRSYSTSKRASPSVQAQSSNDDSNDAEVSEESSDDSAASDNKAAKQKSVPALVQEEQVTNVSPAKKSGSGALLVIGGIAVVGGIIYATSSSKKKKGLNGTDETEPKPEALGGVKKSSNRKRSQTITI